MNDLTIEVNRTREMLKFTVNKIVWRENRQGREDSSKRIAGVLKPK